MRSHTSHVEGGPTEGRACGHLIPYAACPPRDVGAPSPASMGRITHSAAHLRPYDSPRAGSVPRAPAGDRSVRPVVSPGRPPRRPGRHDPPPRRANPAPMRGVPETAMSLVNLADNARRPQLSRTPIAAHAGRAAAGAQILLLAAPLPLHA